MTFGILALGFPVSEVLQLLQPLVAHSLTFFPVSEVLQLLQPLGAHSLTFFSIYLPYLHAFLRWRLASWLWGSLVRRFCSFCSLWGLTVSLSSLYIFPIFMHSLGDVWHPGSGVPCFAAFAAFGGSQSHFLPYIFPIFMHSLGDVWHPGSGVPCFGGFAAFGGSQSHFLPYIFPILLHSLGDVWHPGSGVPCFAAFAAFGGSQSHFLPYISSLSSCIP